MPTIFKPKKKNQPKHNKNIDISKIYNTPQWKNLRNAYFLQHPLCEKCLEEGKTTPTEEIHHIKPISTGADLEEMKSIAYNPDNLMALCKECHHRIHQQMKTKH